MGGRGTGTTTTAMALGALLIGCGADGEPVARDEGPRRVAAAGQAVPAGVASQSRQIEEEIRAEGGEQRVGPWRLAYIVEPAEPWYERRDARLRWREVAQGETHHIEVLPIEAATGRVVPEVPIRVEVLDADGRQVEERVLAPYYAEFFHYANNFRVPQAGAYTLRVKVGAPRLRHHGEETQPPPLAQGAEAVFRDVRLESGR